MKLIAFYLPQFYSFPENDEWWGIGFTEWTNTRKAKPLFSNHYQPRSPQNNNYYCLTDVDTIKWQAGLARENGIYGFCFYHYWFKDGKKLLEKPVELFLKNSDINIPFCLSWANEPWTRSWDGKNETILMPQEYGGEEEWRTHFEYLLPFFSDRRYIRIDGKPAFVFYRPEIFPKLESMINLWNNLAVDNGLGGITWLVQGPKWNADFRNDSPLIDYKVMFEPGYTGNLKNKDVSLSFLLCKYASKMWRKINPNNNVNLLSYKQYATSIINRRVNSPKLIPGFFVDWDNTARRGKNANVFFGSSPEVFKKYLIKLIVKTRIEYQKDYIFINAWNEWAEGCYLEPDEKYGDSYLRSVKEALIETNEWVG